MRLNILAIGDVVGEEGLKHLERHLRQVKKLKDIHFTVVNGENASGVGLTPDQAWRMYDAGADAVTLGNHAFGKMQICSFLDDTRWILRPANYTGRMPGHGWEIFDVNGIRIRVVNLIGRCDLAWGTDNPFTTVDRILERGKADITLVDFHAEATSEKYALAHYLDGKVSAVVGTHTHVQTNDDQILPKGTAYISDAGCVCALDSVLGMEKSACITKQKYLCPVKFEVACGGGFINGVVIDIDTKSKTAASIEKVHLKFN